MKEGRYQYLDKIGEGGMATVYRGVQRSLNRPVAIKVLAATLSNNPSVIKRFKRESLIIAGLNHPNIIHVIDKGTTSKGRPVFVMEFVEGITLADAIADNCLNFNEKVDLVVQLCKGVAYAHKLDVIHRDIKPANVIIDKEGFAKLLDFGIASFFQSAREDSADETRLILGTEAYMAPEQQKGIAETTTLSDVYSLGVVMFELFTGQLPSPNAAAILAADANMTQALATIIMRCLEHEPSDRPRSVEDVKTNLLLAMKGQHIAEEKANRAEEGLTSISSKFGLLDVMREDKFSAAYLYEDKVSHNLLVIKKRNASTEGYKEAKLLCSLKSPHIANVLGASKNDNMFIVVMEYVAGGSLQDRLLEPMAFAGFLPLAIQLAKGMAFAHKNRIVHRNLRPSNVLLSSDMQVKIADFGLDEHYRLRSEERNWYGDGRKVSDELSDVFSLGAIFYHMLTGMPPDFKDGRLVKSQYFVDLPRDLQVLIERMVAKDLDQRPQSAEAVVSELLPFIEDAKTIVKARSAENKNALKTKTIIKYQRTNSLTYLLALVLALSISFNVLLINDSEKSINSLITMAIDKALLLLPQ